ncbi:murein biosynthesis integral membrane protein MurJ [Acidobacteriia bacterium AH_259_A11_L15]|nr:murein biosynthesis integral membrane protein MurJ [Acidobacteriia bacterium AH_259_A11_L15]
MSTTGAGPTGALNEKHQILRSTRVVTFFTLLSRFFGYARDLAIAMLLGTSRAGDAFVIAFRIPNLLRRLMAEGAMTGAFIPVFTSYRTERTEAESWDLARRMFWTLATVLAGVTVLGVIFAPQLVRLFTLFSREPEQWSLAVDLTRITFPYCVLVALTALAGAALNTVRVFGLPASVPIFLNIAIITAAVAAWWGDMADPAIALALGVVLGGLLQLLVQLPALLRRGMRFGFRLGFGHAGVRRVARLMLPAVAGVGVYQINVLVSTIFASQGEGWIAALYYADRLMEVALGAYAISVATVVLPVMSQQAADKKFDEMRGTLEFSLRNVAFIVVPAAVGLILLREPLVRMLFQHRAFGSTSTELTAWALLFYALGLPAFSAVRLLVQGFYATQDTATPVRVAAVALVANVVLCFLLVGPLRHGGLALATSLASYLNFLILYIIFRRRLGAVNEAHLAFSVGRALAAAAGMGALVWLLRTEWSWMSAPGLAQLLPACLATVAAGMASYLALAWLLRAEELGEVYTLVTGRRMKQGIPRVQAAVPYTPNQK